jgi:hypothetical protein
MMAPLNICGFKLPSLADVLGALPARANKSEWRVREVVEEDGKAFFEVHDADSALAAAQMSGRKLSHAELVRAAQEMPTVIWARLEGIDTPGGTEPWIVISAVDSQFWEIVTEDMKTRDQIRKSFADVEVGKL